MSNTFPKRWYYRHGQNGETHGPVSEQELVELAKFNLITATTLIQPPNKGGKWFYASQFKGLIPDSPASEPQVATTSSSAEPVSKAPSNPNLMSCPDCDVMVSKRATSCPKCGCPLQGRAVECRLSFSREYDDTGSLRTSYVFIDDQKIAALDVGETETVVVSAGGKKVSFYVSGLLGGSSLQETLEIDIKEGDHLIIDFNPFGGFFGVSFVWEMSEKLRN